METTQIIAIGSSIIGILFGIVLHTVRATVSRLESNDKEIFSRISNLETTLSALKSAHDTVMEQGGHKRRP